MSTLLSRRSATQQLLLLGSGIWLPACGTAASGASSSGGSSSSSGGSASSSGGSSSSSGGSSSSSSSGGPMGWARGGTAAMTDAARYPNPFGAVPASCALVVAMTGGPCTEAMDWDRRDVSEGAPGLPMRLLLRVLGAGCMPLVGAKVKIWHTNLRGSYSGDTPNNAFCINDPEAATKHYFRGVQTTDASGIVSFDSCFPGWYPGRAMHIHFTVVHAGRSATSQVFFEQTLNDEIFSTHPDYQPFGLPDTPNARDGIGGAAIPQLTLATRRMSDGAMLAYRDVMVSS
jgi:protocatechuate 3,4-dioxygenase beta subunit